MRRMRAVVVAAAVLAAVAASAQPAAAQEDGVLSWGFGSYGMLGIGEGGFSAPDAAVPVQVSALTGVKALAGGDEHVLALLENGTVDAWGYNKEAALGESEQIERAVPTPVEGLEGVTAIAAGNQFSLALLEDGTVLAWGANGKGQLGDGSQADSATPVAVSGLSGVVAIAAGGDHALALLSDGDVTAWGGNQEGQLGNGTIGGFSKVPVLVAGLSGAVRGIAASRRTSFAILESGEVESWGSNDSGALGVGKRAEQLGESAVPLAVDELTGVRAISSSGSGFTSEEETSEVENPQERVFALLEDGTVDGWGGFERDTGSAPGDAPAPLLGLSGVTAIAAGSHFTIAEHENGTLSAFGYPIGLGDGQELGSATTPVSVCGVSEAGAIAASDWDAFVAAPPQPLCGSVEEIVGIRHWGAAGAQVQLRGRNLDEVTAVSFGATPASGYTIESANRLTAVAPPGEGVVDVRVSTAQGQSPDAARFTYVEPPAIGTCGLTAGGHYPNKSCEPGSGATIDRFEFEPLTEGTMTTAEKSALVLQTAAGRSVTCAKESGGASDAGDKAIDLTALELGECTSGSSSCASSGRRSGDIATSSLEATVGVEKQGEEPSEDKLGLAFAPIGEGAPFAQFSCGTESFSVRGAVIGLVGANTPATSPKVTFKATSAGQVPEHMVDGPMQVLEASVDGGPYERLTLSGKIEFKKLSNSKVDFSSVA